MPGGQSETTAYDAAGRIFSRTDFNGFTTTFRYDRLNRLVGRLPDPRLLAAGSVPVTYAYDLLGRRSEMTDATGTTTYRYDSRSRLIEKATPFGTLSYSYDPAGNVVSVASSNENGTSAAYTYDALHRLLAVNEAASGASVFAYDAGDRLLGSIAPNGVSCLYAYDGLDRLTNATISSGSIDLGGFDYILDSQGRRVEARERGGRQIHYAFDPLNRLLAENVSGAAVNGSAQYEYDAAGNRLSRLSTIPGLPGAAWSYDQNDRLISDVYDQNGNTTGATLTESTTGADAAVSDAYDFEDRLVKRNNGQVQLFYDGDGNLVGKMAGGVTTVYLVDDLNPSGYTQVLEDLTSSNGMPFFVSCVNTFGHTLISQDRLDGGEWRLRFDATDGHGNVRLLSDAEGNVTDAYSYDAFGKLLEREGNSPNPYQFAGERFDADLGLYHLRARYYNPDAGRFWTADPFEGYADNPATLHKYNYCANNPVNATDPSGYETIMGNLFAQGVSLQARAAYTAFNGAMSGAAAAYDAYLSANAKPKKGDIKRAFWSGFGFGAAVGFGASYIGPAYAATIGVAAGSFFGTKATIEALQAGNTKLAIFRGAMTTMGVGFSLAATWTTAQNATTGLLSPGLKTLQSASRYVEAVESGLRPPTEPPAVVRAIVGNNYETAGIAPTTKIWGAGEMAPSMAKGASLVPARSPWPGNGGFIEGTVGRKFLMPGELIDRYGFNGGKFVSPAGTPISARAVRPGTEKLPFTTFRVAKPIEVLSGGVAPWFGENGLGTQHELPVSVNTLLKRGFLDLVPK